MGIVEMASALFKNKVVKGKTEKKGKDKNEVLDKSKGFETNEQFVKKDKNMDQAFGDNDTGEKKDKPKSAIFKKTTHVLRDNYNDKERQRKGKDKPKAASGYIGMRFVCQH